MIINIYIYCPFLRLGGLFSDRPIYKHEERDEFLFYLTSRNRGLWMVGPSVGQFNGGLANRGDPVSEPEYTSIVEYLTIVMDPGVCRGHPERAMEVHGRTILEPGHRSPDNLCRAGAARVLLQRSNRLRRRRPPRGTRRWRTCDKRHHFCRVHQRV